MMKQKHTQCPYCHANASLHPAGTIYGCNRRSQSKHVYLCDHWLACDTYVSAHDRTHRPMGTLANRDLRHKRVLAHRALEHLQQSRHMGKREVHIWLWAKLGLSGQQAHIGTFSDGICDEIIRLCYKATAPLGNLHSAA